MAAACAVATLMSLTAFLLGCAVFSSPVALHGQFVYDDKGTVTFNPTVSGELPLSDIWTKDLWGAIDITSEYSHKSWRPLATLTLRWNFQYAGRETFTYHLVNVLLHGLTSALALPACLYMEADLPVAFAAAMMFAAHPVHVEAVAAITGRCDVMCGFFFMLGFVAYCWSRGPPSEVPGLGACWLMFLSLLIFSPAALFSKELGIILPYWCVAWDIYVSQLSLGDLLCFRDRAQDHMTRHLISLASAVALTLWRLAKNGDSLPDLGDRASPVYTLPTVQDRALSNAWQHVRHATMLTGLTPLCPDWSDGSVAFVASFTEWRAIFSGVLYVSLLPVLWRLLSSDHRYAPVDLGLAFAVVNFVLSSNVLLRVGFVLAERVLYLPSLGSCLVVAYALQAIGKVKPSFLGRHGTGMAMALVAIYSRLCWSYAESYGGPEYLWPAARVANPHSGVIIYELGMTLHNIQKHQESIDIMELGFEQYPHLFHEDLQAHFILAEGQRKVGNCEGARKTCQKGLQAMLQREDGRVLRGEAYLHVTLSRCAESVEEASREAHEAITIAHRIGDQDAYDYALEHATDLQRIFEKAGVLR